MDIKFDRDTNVCEYFNEANGSIVHVLSNDSGLWFNLNDAFNLFGAIKANKLWFSKNLTENDKRWVEFNRNNRKGRELFITEQKMHELISKIQEDFDNNVDFIYGIIADYDTTCININDVELNVEERIALHALKAESENFVERSEKYLDILKGKTSLSESYFNFESELNDEIKSSEMKYDNEKCPEDLRQEKRRSKQYTKDDRTPITSVDIIKEVSDSLEQMLDGIQSFVDSYDETYEMIELLDEYVDYTDEPPYDNIVFDAYDLNNNIQYVQDCIEKKQKIMNAIMKDIEELEQEHKNNK